MKRRIRICSAAAALAPVAGTRVVQPGGTWLGQLYERGWSGVARDYAESLKSDRHQVKETQCH